MSDDPIMLRTLETARRRAAAVRLLAAGMLAALVVMAAPPPARAQVAALVNGEPITALDVTQRIRLIQLSTRKTPSRQEALEELIDEKLKIQVAKRFIAEIPERDVESAFANVARRAGLSTQQFGQVLQQNGITPQAFKSRLRSDFVWNAIIRGKFQGQLQVGDRDVSLALQSKGGEKGTTVYDYSLRPILLLVPRGSPPGAFESRRREAENLRARFDGCGQGVTLARSLRDVAIRPPITRSSADFAAQQREVLANTPVGKLTPPDTTAQGIELFAVCAKQPAKNADTATERETRDEIFNKKFQALSKSYLQELRRSALIEIR